MKKNKIIQISNIIFALLLIYMLISNVMYLVYQTKNVGFTAYNITITVIDILINIYLLFKNIVSMVKMAKRNKKKEDLGKALNTLELTNALLIFTYFLALLYRIETYIVYIIATIPTILVIYNTRKLMKEPEKNFVKITEKKLTIFKLLTAIIIISALVLDFMHFKAISNSVQTVKENMSASAVLEMDDGYNLDTLYASQKNTLFLKLIVSILYVTVICINTIFPKKTNKITRTIMLIMWITLIVFAKNGNSAYSVVQMLIISALYDIVFKIEKFNKKHTK